MQAEDTVEASPAQSVLLVGLGGLGCPAALALVRAGVRRVLLCDDDVVDETNLHRQILFGHGDVGRDKLDAAMDALAPLAAHSGTTLEPIRQRFLPKNARALARAADLVIEGADNFATKFLVADACYLEGRPAVHGAAIRWIGTAWAVGAAGQPCYRCLFEAAPAGVHQSCDGAGVMGPVVGIVGAMMAELGLRLLAGRPPEAAIWSLDGKADRLRRAHVHPRSTCSLCGLERSIHDITESRYLSGATHPTSAN